MDGLDEVLARLAEDDSWRALLERDPARALEGYRLSAADLNELATRLAGPARPGGFARLFLTDDRRPAPDRADRLGSAPAEGA